MSTKIQIPGQQAAPAPTSILPPIPSMIEQVWAITPKMATGMNQLAHMENVTQQQIAHLQVAHLEFVYMFKHLAAALGATIPNIIEIRDEIKRDRVKFLQEVLASEGVDAEQRAHINKEIEEIQNSMSDASAPKPEQYNEADAPNDIEG